MKITFHNDLDGMSDAGILNYAGGNVAEGEETTTWRSADLRTASKKANNPVEDGGRNVKSAGFGKKEQNDVQHQKP